MGEVIDFKEWKIKKGHPPSEEEWKDPQEINREIFDIEEKIGILEEKIKSKEKKFKKLQPKLYKRMHYYYGLTKNRQEINEYEAALDTFKRLRKTVLELRNKKNRYESRLKYLSFLLKDKISHLEFEIKSLEQEIKEKEARKKALEEKSADKPFKKEQETNYEQEVSDQDLIKRLKIELWDLKRKKSSLLVELEKLKRSPKNE